MPIDRLVSISCLRLEASSARSPVYRRVPTSGELGAGADRDEQEGLRQELANLVGSTHVFTDADMVAGYVTDWTGAWRGWTRAVVRPGTVDEIRQVVLACAEAAVPIVPQGGNTGLVGGSVPHHGEVVLSLRRFTRLDPVDTASGQVTAGAGVIITALRDHARRYGFDYGVDLASRDSATVGGTIATNAGGVRVIANGDTRRQVLGLEVVLADGNVISRLAGIEKDSAGFDLSQLFVGSEGTLWIVPPPPGSDSSHRPAANVTSPWQVWRIRHKVSDCVDQMSPPWSFSVTTPSRSPPGTSVGVCRPKENIPSTFWSNQKVCRVSDPRLMQ